METLFLRSDVEAAVINSLSRVFGMGVDEISLQSSLVNDLGADSLDFVELRAVLEKQFGVVLPTHSVLEHAVRLTGDEARFSHAGLVTQAGAELLWKSAYEFTKEQVHEGTRIMDLMDVMTVANWVALCNFLIRALPDVCPQCGHGAAILNAKSRLVCASCAEPLSLPSGDEAVSRQIGEMLNPIPA